MSGMTDIYETINRKAEELFEWAQAHPKYSWLIVSAICVFWLFALFKRWKWSYHWQYNGKLWFFDDCKPETKRGIFIVLVSIVLFLSIIQFFSY